MKELTKYILLDQATWKKVKTNDDEYGFYIKINDIQYSVEKTQVENNGVFYSIQNQNWLDYNVLESFSILKCWVHEERETPGSDGTPIIETVHTTQGEKGPFIIPSDWLELEYT